MLHAAEILFANLAAVGIAEGGITFLSRLTEEAVGEDRFKLADAEFGSGDFAQEGGDACGGECVVEGLADVGEGLLVLDGDAGLFEHRCARFLGDGGPLLLRLIGKAESVPLQNDPFFENLERETGIEPATNSLEGCDSTTELLPRFPLDKQTLAGLQRASAP